MLKEGTHVKNLIITQEQVVERMRVLAIQMTKLEGVTEQLKRKSDT